MGKKFSDLRAKMTPESQARVEAKAQMLLAEMPLNELRQARGLSQKMLADVLHVQQPSIAKIENVLICIYQHYVVISKQWVDSLRSLLAFQMVL